MLLRASGLRALMPLVVVQIMVGIVLGPSVFGRIAPDYFQMFASPAMLSSLSGLAFVGVLIFGLISGLHLDPGVFSGNERAFWPDSASECRRSDDPGLSGWRLDPGASSRRAPRRRQFRRVHRRHRDLHQHECAPGPGSDSGRNGPARRPYRPSRAGVAGVNNVVLWILLGVLLTGAAGHSGGSHALPPVALLALAPAYLFVMIQVVRPMLANLIMARMRDELVNTRALVVVGAATIASALATELMGLHYIIGAFVVGAIIPAKFHEPILDRLQVMTVALLMPFFFTLTGMRILIDPSSPVLLEMFLRQRQSPWSASAAGLRRPPD